MITVNEVNRMLRERREEALAMDEVHLAEDRAGYEAGDDLDSLSTRGSKMGQIARETEDF